MTNLDKIIGDVIFISFRDIKRIKDLGITSATGHFILKGYDQMGIWLAHPGLIVIKNQNESGDPLPVSEHTKETIIADFIVTWDNINTIMHYPERKGYDMPSEFDQNIGFHIEGKETED